MQQHNVSGPSVPAYAAWLVAEYDKPGLMSDSREKLYSLATTLLSEFAQELTKWVGRSAAQASSTQFAPAVVMTPPALATPDQELKAQLQRVALKLAVIMEIELANAKGPDLARLSDLAALVRSLNLLK